MPSSPQLQLRIVGQQHQVLAGTPGQLWRRRLEPVIAPACVIYGCLAAALPAVRTLPALAAAVLSTIGLSNALIQVTYLSHVRRIDRQLPAANEEDAELSPRLTARPILRRILMAAALFSTGVILLDVLGAVGSATALILAVIIGLIHVRLARVKPEHVAWNAIPGALSAGLLVLAGWLIGSNVTTGTFILVVLPVALIGGGAALAACVYDLALRRGTGVLMLPASRHEIRAGRLSVVLLASAYAWLLTLVGSGHLPFWSLLPVVSFPLALKCLVELLQALSTSGQIAARSLSRLVWLQFVFVVLLLAGSLLATAIPL